MTIKESAQNYLEAILVLSKKNGFVRSIDIANEMNFSKPSISVAIKRLKEDGCVTVDKNGGITLTKKGEEIASMIYERHEIIAKVLMHIGVNEETAYKDSCKIEHDLSNETFEKIKEYYNKNCDK